jgi:polyhydroxybutyrate depolymerase
VVYPDGDGRAWNVGGGCCGAPGRTNVDDVAFLSAVVKDVESALPIDTERVFATGISNGGMMDYRLACDTALFAAIGADSATLLGDCPSPHPLSVLAIHGTADQSIPYEGGQGSGFAKIDGPSIPDVNQLWRTADSCEPPTSTTSGQVTMSTATCPDSRTVELVTVNGAGHQWPGSTKGRQGADTPFPDLDATAVIWAFFAAHPGAPN